MTRKGSQALFSSFFLGLPAQKFHGHFAQIKIRPLSETKNHENKTKIPPNQRSQIRKSHIKIVMLHNFAIFCHSLTFRVDFGELLAPKSKNRFGSCPGNENLPPRGGGRSRDMTEWDPMQSSWISSASSAPQPRPWPASERPGSYPRRTGSPWPPRSRREPRWRGRRSRPR